MRGAAAIINDDVYEKNKDSGNNISDDVESEDNNKFDDSELQSCTSDATGRTIPQSSSTLIDIVPICIELQKEIAGYAYEQIQLHRQIMRLDMESACRHNTLLAEVIGSPSNLADVKVEDFLQACVGAYVYKKILVGKPAEFGMEEDIETWLQSIFGPEFRPRSGLLWFILDQAVSIQRANNEYGCRRRVDFYWPAANTAFNRDHMVTWTPAIQPLLISLIFGVIANGEKISVSPGSSHEISGHDVKLPHTKNTGWSDRRPLVYCPATVILKMPRKRGRRLVKELEEENKRLRYLLTYNGQVWVPIHATSLCDDRDWDGYPPTTELLGDYCMMVQPQGKSASDSASDSGSDSEEVQHRERQKM